MELAFHLPINSVSFGQVSVALLREAYRKGREPFLFHIQDKPDLSAQEADPKFFEWIQHCSEKTINNYSRDIPIVKLWHLNSSLESYSKNQALITFYELDQPTATEINIARNQAAMLLTSKYAIESFEAAGVKCRYLPLGFDDANFKRLDKKFFPDNRITFNLAGKFEKRKNHGKVLAAWAKKFGNNRNYFLNCALYNNFFSPEENTAIINKFLEGQKYFNINFLGFMPKNTLYNDFLNAGDIILGMSGGEGWGLPEFQSLCLGKHAVMLDAHSYKDWANEKNSVLVSPTEKIPAYDGKFFHEGAPFNQGNIFDFDEDEFISACETAIKRVEENRVNKAGEKLKKKFTYSKTLEALESLTEELS